MRRLGARLDRVAEAIAPPLDPRPRLALLLGVSADQLPPPLPARLQPATDAEALRRLAGLLGLTPRALP